MALTKVKAGNILLTTPAASSNDVTPATTAYVTTALANMVDSAPSTLNTLNELAAALGDDANFSTTVTNSIATKLPLAGGTLTGALVGTTAAFSTSSTTDAVLKLTDSGVADYEVTFPDTGTYQLSTGTSSTKTFKLLNSGSGTFGLEVLGKGFFGSVGTSEGDSKANMGNNAVLQLKPHDSNSTNMTFAQVNNGSGMGIQVSNGSQTANWDIALNPFGGNVGIGNPAPSSWAKLEVVGSAGSQTGANQAFYVKASTATANEGVGIRMSAASGSHEAVGIIGMVNNASGNAGSMTFHTYNLGSTIPEVMRITNTGNVGIGNSAPNTKLYVQGPQDDTYGQLYIRGGSANNQDPQIAMGSNQNGRGFYIDDSAVNRFKIYTGHGKGASSGAYEFVLDNSGTIESKRTYNNTTGSFGANVYVHTDGSFNRATSSRRYKKDIVDADKGLDEILQLKPRNYKPENNRTDSSEVNAEVNDPHLDAAERTFAGLIAEEVHDLGLTEYVDYEEDGTTPSGLYYGNMVALLVKGIQEQQTIINDLKARIETLEG